MSREELIDRAQKFAVETHCLEKGHIMSTIPQQDKRYCEAMADFAASETNELVTVLRELVEAVDVSDRAMIDHHELFHDWSYQSRHANELQAARDLLKSLEPTTSKTTTANGKDE